MLSLRVSMFGPRVARGSSSTVTIPRWPERCKGMVARGRGSDVSVPDSATPLVGAGRVESQDGEPLAAGDGLARDAFLVEECEPLRRLGLAPCRKRLPTDSTPLTGVGISDHIVRVPQPRRLQRTSVCSEPCAWSHDSRSSRWLKSSSASASCSMASAGNASMRSSVTRSTAPNRLRN
jgi:hypothetical protein